MKYLEAIIIFCILIGFFIAGMFTGRMLYRYNHPVQEQSQILKEYEVVVKEDLPSGWYKYTFYDISSGIYDSIQVNLEDELIVGYDKIKLIK